MHYQYYKQLFNIKISNNRHQYYVNIQIVNLIKNLIKFLIMLKYIYQ